MPMRDWLCECGHPYEDNRHMGERDPMPCEAWDHDGLVRCGCERFTLMKAGLHSFVEVAEGDAKDIRLYVVSVSQNFATLGIMMEGISDFAFMGFVPLEQLRVVKE